MARALVGLWTVFQLSRPRPGRFDRPLRTVIALYGLAGGFVVFALLYGLCRRLGLGDSGRKLRRLEDEVRSGSTFDSELAERLHNQREGDA